MALIDDSRAWILRLFEREEHDGRGADCARHPEGVRPAGLPLGDDERVYGVYKGKYHFTPASLIILDRGTAERIPWAEVRGCSTRHGEGKTFSHLTMADGRRVRVRVGDMATGWTGRISQLFHQLIERHGQLAAVGRPLMPARTFFAKAADDHCIAPNLEPHPSLESFRTAVLALEQAGDGTAVLMDLADDDELVAEALVIVTPGPAGRFQAFADAFGADGVLPADEQTLRRVGQVPAGCHVWHVPWD